MGFVFFSILMSILCLLIGAVILIWKILRWMGLRIPRVLREYLDSIFLRYSTGRISGKVFAALRFIKEHQGRRLAILLVFLSLYYWLMLDTGLPSDEAMISRFQENYPAIEKLVHNYRFYEAPPDAPHYHSGWWDQQEVKDLLIKAGVYDVTYLARGFWLPNPYSVETAQMIEEKFRVEPPYSMSYKYSPIQVSLSPRIEYINSSSIYMLVWKRFMYFPEPPRIEDGYLLGPVDTKGEHIYKIRVMSSLDRFPFYFEMRECVYRKINPHWFLSLCNGH